MEKDPSTIVMRYAASLFLVAGAVLLIFQLTGHSWWQNIKAEVTAQPYARTITVTGEGKISAKPDIANVSLSVVSKGATVKLVTLDNNTKMNAVIAAVQALGVDSKDITTSAYDLYPNYDYTNAANNNKILGYNLTQEITLKVRDLTKVDDILDAGTKAGANQVGSLSFDIDDTGPVKAQARQKAFEVAKQKAQDMASEVGVGLGRVITFSEEAQSNPVPVLNYAMAMKTDAAVAPAPSIQAGQKELVMDVSVTYEIQ